MHAIRLFLATLVILLCPWWTLAEEPWAVFTGQSVMEVRSGLRHLYKRLDRKDLVAALDAAGATNLISGNLRGLDLTRPLGSYVLPNASGLGTVVSFVPITGDTEFRGFLERHGLNVGAEVNGITTVQVPLLGSVAMKFDRRYAFFALTPDDLRPAMPDPAQSIPAVHRKTHLAATIYVERIPQDQREVWAKRAEQAVGWLGGGESTRGRLAENLALPIAGSTVRLLAQQARTVTLLAHANSRDDVLWAEMVIDPRPGTRWAEQAVRLQARPGNLDVDARTWARLRGVPAEKSEPIAQAVFTKPGMETIHLTATGGETIRLKAQLSGAVLAYHAALDKEKPPRERKPRRRDRDR